MVKQLDNNVEVFEHMFALAKTFGHPLAYTDLIIDAQSIYSALNQGHDFYWLLRTTGSDFCQDEDVLVDMEGKRGNKVAYAYCAYNGKDNTFSFELNFYNNR